jgi:hypothetical protein
MKSVLVPVLFCWLAAAGGFAQSFGPPLDGDSTNQLSVWLDLRWNTNNAVFHAPARIDLVAYVRMEPHPHAGDAVPVEFFADSKRLGSGKAVWHDVIRPHARPGEAVPMWIMAAQFYPAEFVWKKVPEGVYMVTAKAIWTNGLSAVSAPLKVTVLP